MFWYVTASKKKLIRENNLQNLTTYVHIYYVYMTAYVKDKGMTE